MTVALILAGGPLALAPTRANADDSSSDSSSASDLEIHGFLSQGFIKTTDNNYLTYSKLGSFDFTETGLNFTKQLDENLRTGLQLDTERIGPSGDFNVQLDWFYADYHWMDELGIRFGRVKLPFGLYNDTRDIDSARAPILLPQSIYPEQSQEYLLAEDGAELYGYHLLGPKGGALDYRLYGGTIFITDTTPPQEVNVPYLAGGRLMWETPVEGLRAGMSVQIVRLDIATTLGPTLLTAKAGALFWVTSVEYTKGDLWLAAEYERTYVNTSDGNSPLIPTETTISQAGYVMGAYRLNSWLEPAVYYSVLFPNISDTSGQQNQQHDISATLRFDINRFWLVKVEGHYMIGTAGLNPALNNVSTVSALASPWTAFLVKTTAYF